MRVSNAQIQKVLEVHLHRCRTTGHLPACAPRPSSEQLVLSPRAAAIQIVKEKAAALPEVRQDVVQNVIQRLQSDAYRPYRPDPDELAQRILSANVRLKGKQQ